MTSFRAGLKAGTARLRRRWRERLPSREILVRSNGDARVVLISSTKQMAVLGLLAAALLAVGIGLASAIGAARAELARLRHQQTVVARRTAGIEAFNRSAAHVARDLEERQRLIETLVTSRLGPVDAPPAPAPGATPAPAKPAAPAPAAKKVTSLYPAIEQMRRLEGRQTAFVGTLVAAFDARSRRMETQLRGLGLNPKAMLSRARTAQGGPLERLPDAGTLMTPALKQLADSVARLGMLEDTLIALPSGLPTQAQMVTSSYGVRRDPFTGEAAFHPGIDFVGSYGQSIMAAADGKVAFAGMRNGYGNCVEIDHGNGIITRYGHLSGFVAHVGDTVTRGQAIARMGSTGRSTGTHLHFEVRVDGHAVDPRPFLQTPQTGLGTLQSAERTPPKESRHGRARRA